MRTETRKLASIATVLCGSMVTFGAHASEQATPVPASAAVPEIAGGVVEPLVLRDTAPSTDAMKQAVVDAFPAQTPRVFADDSGNALHVPVSYAAPIAVVTPRTEALADAADAVIEANPTANGPKSGTRQDAIDEAVRATVDVTADAKNDAVIDEASYAVDGAKTSSTPGREMLVQRDAANHQDASDVTAPAPAVALEEAPPVKPLPVSYAAPIAVVARGAQASRPAAIRMEAEAQAAREQPFEQAKEQLKEGLKEKAPGHAQSIKLAPLTSDATPATPPVPPAHQAPVANEREVAKAPVSYARPIAVPVSRAATGARKQMSEANETIERPVAAGTFAQTPERPLAREGATPKESTGFKAPVSYAAPIAVSQAARNDMPSGRAREVGKAQTDTEDPSWSSKTTVAISEEKLDAMRGGFDVANGLKVSFGVSRMAFVNGNLVTQTSFNIPDLSNMTTQQAQALAAANMGSMLQNGAGNVAQQGAVQGLSGAVIQNTLSNQNIQALTTINASVNSLGFFKNMNLGATLNNALMNSVRPR